MSRKVRENIIASDGDYAVFATGQPIYADNETLEVLPGQLVFFDPRTQISVASTTVADNPDIVIAVGVDTTGDGSSDSLRKCFGDKLYGNYISTVTAEPPRSGVAQIRDILFTGAENDTTYSVNITVEDDRTQNQNDYKRKAIYTFSTTTQASGATEADVACGLIDAINNNIVGNAARTSVFNKLAKRKPNLPFKAVRLFDNTFNFCLASLAGSCDTCLEIEGITGMFANTAATVFTNTTLPGDTSKSRKAQLKRIVNLINTTLDGNGSAVITGGVGECAELQLQVNTCYSDFKLHNASGDITPCATSNPFDPITLALNCKNCGIASQNVTYGGGIRLIANQVEISCGVGSMPPNPPKGYFGRELDIFPVAGFAKGSTYVRDAQKGRLPENLGYLWQWRDYASDNGGSGRGHDQFASGNYGPLNLPLSRSRSGAANKVVCNKTYCSYVIEHGLPNTSTHTRGNFNVARGRSVILVPSSDTTTIASFETIFNAYTGSSPMRAISAVTCTADGDQTGAEEAVEGFIV